MNSKPLVTIALPTYNRSEELFTQALESVLNQTYNNIEILIADNCSTTINIKEILLRYKNDSRISYHKHGENIGMVENWNWCVNKAKGDWINIFHDDDVMELNHIEKVIEEIKNKREVSFVFSIPTVFFENGDRCTDWFNVDLKPEKTYSGNVFVYECIKHEQNLICCPTVFVKSDVYKSNLPFSSQPIFTTDLNMWFKILMNKHAKFTFLSSHTLNYRIHTGQLTQVYISDLKGILNIEFDRVIAHLDFTNKSKIKLFSLKNKLRNTLSNFKSAIK